MTSEGVTTLRVLQQVSPRLLSTTDGLRLRSSLGRSALCLSLKFLLCYFLMKSGSLELLRGLFFLSFLLWSPSLPFTVRTAWNY